MTKIPAPALVLSELPPPTLKYERPEVAKLIARRLVEHNLDYEAATSRMLRDQARAEGVPAPSDAEIVSQARAREKAPQIQQALQEYLAAIGLGEDAQARVVAGLWHAFLNRENDKRWPVAARSLIELTGLDKQGKSDKPVTLPLGVSTEDLKGMFDGVLPKSDEKAEEVEIGEEDE